MVKRRLKKKACLAILLEEICYMLANLSSNTAVKQAPTKMLDNFLYTGSDTQDFHKKYLSLKRKFKVLLYENESFQEELKNAQRKLLKISRDKSFLLDQLMRYENTKSSSSDSEATISSESDGELRAELVKFKKKKPAANADNQITKNACLQANSTANKAKPKRSKKACPSKLSL